MDPLTAVDGPDELRALLVLDQIEGVGPATLGRLVRRFGSAAAALAASRRAFATVAGAEAARGRGHAGLREEVDRALSRADDAGIRTTTWSDPRYPGSLHHLADPPPVLFTRGRLELLGRAGVTVVGARRATARARDVAERLGRALAGAGVPVVSGLALGVDGSAHRGALSADGPTIAVLGTGPDVPYPPAHRRLFREVAERGLIVSEFLPGSPALPHHFPRRNRILAALGSATVVVEAGARSGALITVDHALDLGRDVWAVPGPIEHGPCAGSNRLLLEGARPVLSIAQIVAEVAPHAPPADPVGEETAGVTPEQRRILAELDGAALTSDEMAARTGLPVAELLVHLTALELCGAVRRLDGARFARAA